ncbi:MAG: hypothetical protein M3336_12930 [Chloroflexota bacterium]|nr:hypothetical protein [Chloroflexota bacterium]
MALATVGILTWGYGTRVGHAGVQWLGIAFVAVAFLLRYARRRQSRPTE